MAIFRCNKCGHIREVERSYIGKSVKCPKCKNISTIHDTIKYLNNLIKKHISQAKVLHKLQKELVTDNSKQEADEEFLFEEIDIHNTNVFTQSNYRYESDLI